MRKMCPAPQQELERERLDKEGLGKREEKHYVNIQTTNKRQLRPGKDGGFVVQKDRSQPLPGQCERKRIGWSEADFKMEHIILTYQPKLNKTSNHTTQFVWTCKTSSYLKRNALGTSLANLAIFAKVTPGFLGAGR